MAIYTGVADANGDFNIPFSTNYTGGQKVTVTAEKDGATKSIELFAPSDTTGGGVIQFSGTLANFPNNIGGIVLSEISGAIGDYAFNSANSGEIWANATSLVIPPGITSIGNYAFMAWSGSTSVSIPEGVTAIGNNAFMNWTNLLSIILPSTLLTIGANAFSSASKVTSLVIPNSVTSIGNSAFFSYAQLLSLTIGSSVVSIGSQAFQGLSACNEIICLQATPPTIQSNTFNGLKATCIIKVPAASVSAYQAAPNWSAYAARIQAI